MKKTHTIKAHTLADMNKLLSTKRSRGFKLVGHIQEHFNDYYGQVIYYAKIRWRG